MLDVRSSESLWMNTQKAESKWLLTCLVVVAGFGTSLGETNQEKMKKAEGLVESLVDLSTFDYGLSPTLGGSDFPPVAGQSQIGVVMLTNHQLQRNEALLKLTELGPHAIPALVKHIDDKRETKLEIKHGGGFGAMWYAEEMPFDSTNEREVNALKKAGIKTDGERGGLNNREDNISSHKVTVGDACFVILGMITNRAYNAVRYQPTACNVVNSPSNSKRLASAVRQLWPDDSASEVLLEQLKNEFNVESQKASAAVRLLYYFPDSGLPLVLKEVKAIDKISEFYRADFLGAIAWKDDESLRDEIVELIENTENRELVASALSAIVGDAADEALRLKLIRMILADLKEYGYGTTTSVTLVTRLLSIYPEQQEVSLKKLFETDKLSGPLVCRTLYGMEKFPVEPLVPLLGWNEEGIGQYIVDGAGVHEKLRQDHYQTYRICDNVYELISRQLGFKKAVCTGSRKDMDAKILALHERLELPAEERPYSADEISNLSKQQNKVKLEMEQADAVLDDEDRLLKYIFPEDPKEEWIDKKYLAELEKMPQLLPVVYGRILKEKPHLQSHPVTDLIVKKLPREKAIETLLLAVSHPNLDHQRAMFFALLELKCDQLPALLKEALEKLPETTAEEYWLAGYGALANLVAKIDEKVLWEALKKAARRVDVGLRLEFMNTMNYTVLEETNLRSRIDFLASFLEDKEMRDVSADKEKFSGPCAAFTIKKLRVCDFATIQLASLLEISVLEADVLNKWETGDWDRLSWLVSARATEYLKKHPVEK